MGVVLSQAEHEIMNVPGLYDHAKKHGIRVLGNDVTFLYMDKDHTQEPLFHCVLHISLKNRRKNLRTFARSIKKIPFDTV